MQKVLIVHAHPEPQSFSAAMKDAAAKELLEMGYEVRISDLYDIQFNPVASANDFSERARPAYLTYALEQRNGYTTNSLAPDIIEQVENVIWADLIIFNFPIYWFSVPAIMKGWIDRVLLSGPFYGGLRFYDRGGLVGKTAWPTFTLGGQQHMFGPQSVHGDLDQMLAHFLRGTLGYLGFKVLRPFVAYHVPYISQHEREGVMKEFQNDVRHLQARDAFSFPTLADFDETLHPILVDQD